MTPFKYVPLFVAALIVPAVGFTQEAVAEDLSQDAKSCLEGASDLVPSIDGTRFDLGEGAICDEEDTGFFSVRVRYNYTSNLPRGGLPQLFHQRAHLYVDAAREGREIRLSYSITPSELPDFWDVTVTDSAGNTRKDKDYIWARNFRALDGAAPSALLLGVPIVYFECSDRQGRSCVATYNVDKCYGAPEGADGDQATARHYYDVAVAAVGPENVEKLFGDYSRINSIAEEILQVISPAACQSAN